MLMTCRPLVEVAGTIGRNMQELEGLQPSQIQSFFYNNGDSLTSANDYVAML